MTASYWADGDSDAASDPTQQIVLLTLLVPQKSFQIKRALCMILFMDYEKQKG